MKFEYIKQFHKSYYRIDIGWDYLQDWLNSMKERGGADSFQMNPDFQRGHVWTLQQQMRYVEYIIQGGESGQHVHFNHPGWQDSYKGTMVCVDGLQRITAILSFMDNKIQAFGYKLNEFDNPRFTRVLRLSVHVGKLQTRKEVLEWYLQMNAGGTPHTKEEIDKVKNMISVYK